MTQTSTTWAVAACCALVIGVPVPEAAGQPAASNGAQTTGGPSPAVDAKDARGEQSSQVAGPGPLVIEQVEDRWVFAPDVRLTEMDDRFATLVGGYGGMVIQEHVLIGAAGYWLANREDDFTMMYGGLVTGWLAQPTRILGVGVRALVGIGDATLSSEYAYVWHDVPRRDMGNRPGGPDTFPPGSNVVQRVIFSDTFFVFEPQADLVIRFADWGRFVVGGGYRVVGAAEGFDDRLRGASGSIAIRFGGS